MWHFVWTTSTKQSHDDFYSLSCTLRLSICNQGIKKNKNNLHFPIDFDFLQTKYEPPSEVITYTSPIYIKFILSYNV